MEGLLQALFALLLGLIALSQVGLWLVLYQVVKQQGRLLLRLDELAQAPPTPSSNPDVISLDGNARAAPIPGLPVGSTFRNFRVSDLAGQMVSLEDFDRKRRLLVHWSPECGFCDLIAPDLAKLQPDLQQRGVQLVLVSYGEVEPNLELAKHHGLECPILLQQSGETVEAFDGLGTPVAYLLDTHGKVSQPLVVGADQVLALARTVAAAPTLGKRLPGERSLRDSRIEREGLKAGTRAPSFKLPDIGGDTVALEDYRGQQVLLVFSDPQCGPCQALAPELAQLHREHGADGLALIMVGRGDPEENRRHARQQGIQFPVALQQRWEISRAYGIFATPVAFLIDEDGVIARDVAKGVDAILALARERPAAAQAQNHDRTVR